MILSEPKEHNTTDMVVDNACGYQKHGAVATLVLDHVQRDITSTALQMRQVL
jgi:hypothetical protein